MHMFSHVNIKLHDTTTTTNIAYLMLNKYVLHCIRGACAIVSISSLIVTICGCPFIWIRHSWSLCFLHCQCCPHCHWLCWPHAHTHCFHSSCLPALIFKICKISILLHSYMSLPYISENIIYYNDLTAVTWCGDDNMGTTGDLWGFQHQLSQHQCWWEEHLKVIPDVVISLRRLR